MPQGPNYGLQGGSQWVVAASGTLTIGAAGSINVESGGVINVASGGSVVNAGVSVTTAVVATNGTFGSIRATDGTFAGTIILGGTAGRWAFGTLGLASGVGSVQTGLTTVVAAWCNSLSGVQGGLGSMSSAVIDPVNFGNGSIIFRGLAGTLAFTGNNGTVCWAAFGY